MYKIYGKCDIFLMGVVISSKYGKRFRFAPSFNNSTIMLEFPTFEGDVFTFSWEKEITN